MTVKKRRLIANFEARSVALFATLSLGTVMALHAQTAAQQPIPPSKNNWTTAQISEAFKRLDANGDGLISREEAAVARGVAKHFDQASGPSSVSFRKGRQGQFEIYGETSHTLIFPSWPPEASFVPSGLKATSPTAWSCP